MSAKDSPSRGGAPAIRFGTDGWRGVIADDFTFANVRAVALAIGRYVLAHEEPRRGLVIGYDTRFLSDRFARASAEALSGLEIPVTLAAEVTPSPVLSFAVRHLKAAGGIMITASHNPYKWSGVKFKASYGGSAGAQITTRIEEELRKVLAAAATPPPAREALIRTASLKPAYLEHIAKFADLASIRDSGFRFAVCPMHGAGHGYLKELFDRHGIPCEEIAGEPNPLFPGMNPEPLPPHTDVLREGVLEHRLDAGFALDGDGDRLGAIDRTGEFVDSHRIFAILLWYLAERKQERGEVAKTFSTSKLVDKVARKYGLAVTETPIGFKYICDLMRERNLLLGGEESGGIGVRGHIPERDGTLIALLLASIMASERKTLGELVDQLMAEFGPHYYGRVDLELPLGQTERAIAFLAGPVERFAGAAVTGREDLDGIKLYLGPVDWVMARASGTEPVLRIYVEAVSTARVREILAEAERAARNA